jgi:hypothetical protein
MDVPASDFDGAWKEALERYFEPFTAFFFPQVHSEINWSRPPEFRDTELQQIAPEQQRGKQHVDKLVRVSRVQGADAWVFVHIEVQSQYDSTFPERMFRYHARLFDRERQPVVSLAVLGDEQVGWQPNAFGYELWGCELQLRFPVAKLTLLDQATLEAEAASSQRLFCCIETHRKPVLNRESGCAERQHGTGACCRSGTPQKTYASSCGSLTGCCGFLAIWSLRPARQCGRSRRSLR